MSAEQEFAEGLKLVAEIEKELADRAPTLEEQATILENELDGTEQAGSPVERLARFCVLSEICGALDFDRMVAARERFQEAFPEHFSYYLSNLETIGWQTAWPGCLECAHFDGSCRQGLMPMESPESRNRFDRYCESKAHRIT